jgi:TolB protein
MLNKRTACITFILFILLAVCSLPAGAQDQVKTGTNIGAPLTLAVPDFKQSNADPGNSVLLKVFNDTLWSDLENAGLFTMVAKSFYPVQTPGFPNEVNLNAWGNPPLNAAMLAFGNLGVGNSKVNVQGWLFDTKNPQFPQILGKQYQEDATPANARTIAHRFANEIILKLGGIPGPTESKIYFISDRSGHKEVWSMDWDGATQQQVTKLGGIALSPRVSPDNLRVAFSALLADSWQIKMYSLELGRAVSFPRFGGGNYSPAWSSDGTKIAFASSMGTGSSEIFIADASGAGARRLTTGKTDVSPVFNPKTNGQIAFVSGRTGLPQIYIMDADGSNVQRVTDQGYAVSPSWSPNGLLLAFSWIRKYGPGVLGGADIYVMDIASRQIVQLTHDGGRNDFPSWSPDGRHIVFQSTRSGNEQIWSVLADGTHLQQLTQSGHNTQPNWSYR